MSASQPVRKQLQPKHVDSWACEQATWPHHESSRFVNAGGIRWHVQRLGSGPEVLLVHGTGASTHSWRDLMDILAQRYSVIAMDLPGHAFSGPADGAGSSIAGMSASLGKLLRVLGVSPRHCVGHSAGAVVLCRMAIDGTIGPQSMVAINGAFIPMRGAAGRLFAPMARLMTGSSLIVSLVARRAKSRANVARLIAGTGSTLNATGIELYARLVRNPYHVAGALRMMGNWDLYEFNRWLPRLALPLTLMVGDNDLMVPPEQAFVVERQIAHGKVHRLAGLGHLAHEENPRLIAAELMKIYSEHG